MIVLHGWWSIERDPRGELIVWAEDSEAPAQPPVRRGRRPAKQAHPFAVPADALAVMTVREGTPGTAVLALLTADIGAQQVHLPSSSPANTTPYAVKLAAWKKLKERA